MKVRPLRHGQADATRTDSNIIVQTSCGVMTKMTLVHSRCSLGGRRVGTREVLDLENCKMKIIMSLKTEIDR